MDNIDEVAIVNAPWGIEVHQIVNGVVVKRQTCETKKEAENTAHRIARKAGCPVEDWTAE